ncbi:sodium-dependent neutral amino acid transporter B(0)AT3 [Lepeophtheirus salmonis]|uniref:sodium-dependent neutral amino acid transporter B(0)AT3 n=1 Tax=Lepeophtheirus salmonis TaxID=72036 RepID=UPI001AE2473A|nr:sodium-dependent neutral amino acid transporter B(0)AT3-like [Lepeophtheirus salmonis]
MSNKEECETEDFDERFLESGKETERAQWSDSRQFFLTILGFCVGLGNIWRFPYLCQQNGGGAFIIPFIIMMILEGMPLLLLELGMGQRLRTGSLGVWSSVRPWLGGIGFGSAVISTLVGLYYNVIIAWCIYYLFNSFGTSLTWASCPMDPLFPNTTVRECEISSETQYFWYRNTLDITPSIEINGGIRWWMLICLIISWLLIYAIISKGIQSSGKVVYFTALFPYLVLTIFFIRGITLNGAVDGLVHMFYPKLEKLIEPRVWLDAANQVFYSFGLAFGSFISFGSYNPPEKNIVRDVYRITVCNTLTAVYGCAVVFSILGFKARHLFDKCMEHDISTLVHIIEAWKDRNVNSITENEYLGIMVSHGFNASHLELHNCSMEKELNQAAEGTGLAFIVMADVFTMLPGAPFWSILFFSMLLSLGIGSQIGILEGVIGIIFDVPQFKNVKKPILTGITCICMFSIGTLFVTGAGEYWVTLFDSYGALGLTLIALTEIIVVMYVYGHKKFTQDIKMMTGVTPGPYWQASWRFAAPLVLSMVLIMSIYSQIKNTPTYNAWNKELGKGVKVEFPNWTMVIALFLALMSILPIILYGFLNKFFGFSVFGSKSFPRINTSASNQPMLGENSFKEYHDILKSNTNSTDEEDSSDDRGIVVNEDNNTLGLSILKDPAILQ